MRWACLLLQAAAMALGMIAAPFSRFVVVAVALFFMMGSARGVGGVAIISSMMDLVPKHMMGRVQNIFYFVGILLQLAMSSLVGLSAYRWTLTGAFMLVAAIYVTASLLTTFPVSAVYNRPPQTDTHSKEAG